MKPTGEVSYYGEKRKGKADVMVKPSHPLGKFVIKLDLDNGSEHVLKKRLLLNDVSNKDARQIESGDETPLANYAQPHPSKPGRFILPKGAEMFDGGAWEDLDRFGDGPILIDEVVPYVPDSE